MAYKKEKKKLKIFERKIIRKLCGPKKEGEELSSLMETKIDRILKRENKVKFIKTQKVKYKRRRDTKD